MNSLQFNAGDDPHTRINGKGREEPLHWPSSRYFQIHFEQIHLAMAEMRQELELLRRELADTRRRSGACPRCGRGGTTYTNRNLS